jgi:ornithine cyclodeaminase
LNLVRPIRRVYVTNFGDHAAREAYVEEMGARLGIEVIPCDSVAEVVRSSAVVVTTTPAREGFITPEMLHPGLHITAIGSDTEEKQELQPAVLGMADGLFCDLHSQCERLGELRSGYQQKTITPATSVTELGDIINGDKLGRTDDQQITICDLTGVGVQDTMIAARVSELAEAQDRGIHV